MQRTTCRRPHRERPFRSGALGSSLAVVGALLSLVAVHRARPAAAQTPCGADLPCSFGIRGQQIAPVPATFRFQARLSQAKLPVGDREVARVVVRLKRGSEVLCIEEFSEVRIESSVLDLVLGREISCDLDRVLAENHELVLQVCLGGTDNCLRPVVLGTSPYAVKASHALQAQRAQRADVAGQANWVHRVTADRGTLLHKRLRTGWFQFSTPGAAPRLFGGNGFLEYENGGFLQWTPLEEQNPTLHVSAKDHRADTPVPLAKLVLAAERTQATGPVEVESGGVHVRGVSDVLGSTIVRGQLKVERPAGGGPEGVRVLGESRLDGELTVSERLTVQSQGLAVVGDSEVDGDVDVRGDLRVQPEAVGEGWAARVEGTGGVAGVLQVGEATKVAGGGLHSAGEAEVGGALTVSERLSAGDATVGGTLLVLGQVVAPNLDVLPLLGPDGDMDGDWVENARDICPFTPDPEQGDYDQDGRGDACDPDADGDGSSNVEDCLPLNDEAVGPDGLPDTTCDGVDDDCDGETDEEFVAGDCDTGEPGICAAGQEECVDMGLVCIPQNEPEDGDADCDGRDSDCDGELDEDYASVECDSGVPGICADGDTLCVDGEPECVPRIAPDEVEEVCDDGLDNDCDGEVDDVDACGYEFGTSQVIDGRRVTCGWVTNDHNRFSCYQIMIDGQHLSGGEEWCPNEWVGYGPPSSDMRGFCRALGGSGQIHLYWNCTDYRPGQIGRTWRNHVWGSERYDWAVVEHVTCYR